MSLESSDWFIKRDFAQLDIVRLLFTPIVWNYEVYLRRYHCWLYRLTVQVAHPHLFCHVEAEHVKPKAQGSVALAWLPIQDGVKQCADTYLLCLLLREIGAVGK